MLIRNGLAMGAILLGTTSVVWSQDPVQASDYPGVGRIAGYVAQSYEVKRLASWEFQLKGHPMSAEGRRIDASYTCPASATQECGSVLEVQRDFEAVLKSLGGEILVEDPASAAPNAHLVGRFGANGQLVFLDVRPWNDGAAYDLSILEERDFDPSMLASDLTDGLSKNGKAVVHIKFDFDKGVLRADAAPVIQQIVSVLQAQPSLKLEVDGHTDGIGNEAHNKLLSKARADAVLTAIQSAGVPAARLTSVGFGSSAPMGDNANSEGRAQNRRVELVKK